MAYSYEKIKSLQVGDSYYQCSQLGNDYYTIESEIIETIENINSPEDLIQLRWTAKNELGEVKNFLITKNLEHYGPQLYNFPAYVSIEIIS